MSHEKKAESEKPSVTPAPIVVWQQSSRSADKNSSKVVELESYRNGLGNSEATVKEWELPMVAPIEPVRVIMISSGFGNFAKGASGNSITSMAAAA
jgi:hypothetical protein